MRIFVVGYGNPLRGDDGAGQYVAERVAGRRPDLPVILAHQLTPELTVDLAEADIAIFVDARADQPEQGIEVSEVDPADGGASTHHVSPGTLIALARRLFGHAPRAYLVSLPAYSFDFSESLSPRAVKAADEAVDIIDRLIGECTSQAPGSG